MNYLSIIFLSRTLLIDLSIDNLLRYYYLQDIHDHTQLRTQGYLILH